MFCGRFALPPRAGLRFACIPCCFTLKNRPCCLRSGFRPRASTDPPFFSWISLLFIFSKRRRSAVAGCWYFREEIASRFSRLMHLFLQHRDRVHNVCVSKFMESGTSSVCRPCCMHGRTWTVPASGALTPPSNPSGKRRTLCYHALCARGKGLLAGEDMVFLPGSPRGNKKDNEKQIYLRVHTTQNTSIRTASL